MAKSRRRREGAKRKRYRPGITEKRLRNKKFRKTEDAILEVMLKEKDYMGLGAMAKEVGVARSTVYYHHRTVRAIVPDYKAYILMKYRRMIRKVLRNRRVRMRMVYLNMLTFMVINRRAFMIFDRVGDKSVMVVMIDELRRKVETMARLPRNSRKAFVVFRGEVLAILEKWSENAYDEAEIGEVLSDLSYLTETARTRLKGVR